MSFVTIKFDEPFITSAEVVGGYLDNDQLFLRFRNKDINPLAKWLCSLDTSIFLSVDGSDAYTRQRCPEENCMKTIVVSTGETEMDGLTVIRSHQTNIMYEKASCAYDYIVGPESMLEILSKNKACENVDLIVMPTLVDDETLLPLALAGKYPESIFELPIFSPYVLVQQTPCLVTGVANALIRYGWFEG